VLIAPLEGVGRDYPLSIEKLCPVLSFYVVKDWKAGCERCREILRYGGMGHTMSIHSRDDDIILQFGLHKPAFRIVVNTPTTLGSIGLTTGLDPSMTLGCGGFGGNITSDNISPLHLLNIKRLAYEITPVGSGLDLITGKPVGTGFPGGMKQPAIVASPGASSPAGAGAQPRGPAVPTPVLRQHVDSFLQSRGYRPEQAAPAARPAPPPAPATPATPPPAVQARAVPAVPPAPAVEEMDFVAEEDVRRAISRGIRIRLTARAIVTPAARDMAAARDVFVD
jgi:acetaldehyde dehydrogenase (acetylating)